MAVSYTHLDVYKRQHIDVAWLWRLKHTREKAMRSFSTVLRLMDEFDEYVFLQSQPQLYDYVKQDQPQLYEGMKRRAAEGRWEADGGMWLEADCNISSGEALSRQFLQGIRFLKEEFGHECRFLWLPDVFGYSWALPQIMKQCGITSFATTKISWNQFNTMPHDLFWWRGMDGTEIMTYFINTPEPNQPMDSRFATYNGLLKMCIRDRISRGEILDALKSPLPVCTVDGVKKRLRPGMGRCQGGFCLPLVAKIISEYLGVPLSEVRKAGPDSVISYGPQAGKESI